MLAVANLTFTYPGRGRSPALEGLSFTTDAGQMVFVLGPNGSGKSTFFRLLLRLLTCQEGTITLAGRDATSLNHPELARLVSHIPQQHDVTFNFSAYETVLMGRTAHLGRWPARPGPADHEKAERAIARLGIEHLARRGIRDLSGGERQLVLIARALCQEGQILLFDEPTSNLDYANQERVLQEMRDLADLGYLVVVSSHEPMHALQYGDDLLLLRQGRKLASGSPTAISEHDLSALYGTPIRILTAQEAPHMRISMPTSTITRAERRR